MAVKSMSLKAVFLDREGVITPKLGKGEFLLEPHQAVTLDAAKRGLVRLSDSGLKLFIVSNQSCVNRGLISQDSAWVLHNEILSQLTMAGAKILDSRLCFHIDEDACTCRKPKPGMILDLCGEFGLNPSECAMVGDSESDVAAGQAAGCGLIFFIGETSLPGAISCSSVLGVSDYLTQNEYVA